MNLKFNLVESLTQIAGKLFKGQNTLFRELTRVTHDHCEKVKDATWTALNDRLFLIYHELQVLRNHQEMLQNELPVDRYLPERPFSAKFYWLLSVVALIGIESMSWMNAGYFVKETLGDDRYWGALAMSMPIVMAPFVLNFFVAKMPEYESRINKYLFVIFAISMIGWFGQFGNKFAFTDSAQATFNADWNADSVAPAQKPSRVSYQVYLAFQLITECIGAYVAARKLAKYSGPQLDAQFERVSAELEEYKRSIATLHAQEALLKFHRNKLQEEMVSRRCTAENNYNSLSQ